MGFKTKLGAGLLVLSNVVFGVDTYQSYEGADRASWPNAAAAENSRIRQVASKFGEWNFGLSNIFYNAALILSSPGVKIAADFAQTEEMQKRNERAEELNQRVMDLQPPY